MPDPPIQPSSHRHNILWHLTQSNKPFPRYIMRPAPPDPATTPAIEWILFGDETTINRAANLSAWKIACSMGLGPKRIPFRIRDIVHFGAISNVWRLSDARFPLCGPPQTTPCDLSFSSPLRLIRHGKLLLQPEYVDIAVAALRRVSTISGCAQGTAYRDLVREVRAEAAGLPATRWEGARQDLVRWSGSQQREIDMLGVVGKLGLPEGVGQIWPLIAAAHWTHLGKGTVFGLGLPKVDDFHQENE